MVEPISGVIELFPPSLIDTVNCTSTTEFVSVVNVTFLLAIKVLILAFEPVSVNVFESDPFTITPTPEVAISFPLVTFSVAVTLFVPVPVSAKYIPSSWDTVDSVTVIDTGIVTEESIIGLTNSNLIASTVTEPSTTPLFRTVTLPAVPFLK